MLFNARINEIQSQVSSNAVEIDALLLRVEQLRNENLARSSHLQQLGSAESAAESAIEQIKTALMMIELISPAEVATFKGAIDKLFEKEFPLLPQFVDADVVEDAPPVTDDGDSDAIAAEAQEDGDSDAIMVEAQEDGISGGAECTAACNPDFESGLVGGEFPTLDVDSDLADDAPLGVSKALQRLSINQLRKLAKQRQLKAIGNSSDLRRRLFADGITVQDVEVFNSRVG